MSLDESTSFVDFSSQSGPPVGIVHESNDQFFIFRRTTSNPQVCGLFLLGNRYHIGESTLPSMRHFFKFIDFDDQFNAHGFFKKVWSTS